MKHIVSIAYTYENINFDQVIDFMGEKVRLTQYSVNFDYELCKFLLEKFDGKCDVICISGLPPTVKFQGGEFEHPQCHRLRNYTTETPIVDGEILKEVYIPWSIRQFHFMNPEVLGNKKIGFYSGTLFKVILDSMEEFTSSKNILMADPYYFWGLPFNIRGARAMDKYLKMVIPIFKRMTIRKGYVSSFEIKQAKNRKALRDFFDSDVFVGNLATMNLIDLDHLKGKTLVVDHLTPQMEEKLKRVGVGRVIECLPHAIDNPYVNFSMFAAILLAFQKDDRQLTYDSIMNWIDKLSLAPRIKRLTNETIENKSKFAFIIHPLSTSHVFKHPLLRWMKGFSKPLEPMTENILSMTSGFYYGDIKGVISEKNGKEVQGLIYCVPETPKKMMEKNPEDMYKKLVALAVDADHRGAAILGLGAYTKIVGDAGVSVAKRSPIPVTTGNSLSAAATLWAAKYAVEKLGFVKSENGMNKGTAMVVGATGSIGAVSAKILAQSWEEIILVAPRAYKLLELKDEIKKIAPKVKVRISTHPDAHVGDSDLIITTTSSRGKKILDIEKVKSGCVICDVSRPFDIQESDAVKRPDILVIASGEVQLPGDISVNVDLGLEGNIVYACLAETALLLMEGKLESFTLSRDIHYEKVLLIDRLAKEHGVRLSCIMGHSGFITDQEFELCRQHALKKLDKEREHGKESKDSL